MSIIAELYTSQCEGVFTAVARDCEQAVEHDDFESFISAPTKTSQVSEEQRETSESQSESRQSYESQSANSLQNHNQ